MAFTWWDSMICLVLNLKEKDAKLTAVLRLWLILEFFLKDAFLPPNRATGCGYSPRQGYVQHADFLQCPEVYS